MAKRFLLPAFLITVGWLQATDPDYERGRRALDSSDWQGAVEAFENVEDGSLGDAALYWQAYAYNKLGNADRALALATALAERFPDSQWRDDARALVVEIRGSAGADASSDDEELKIMALSALMHTNNEDAVPILREFLAGEQSLRLKERALFVLAQIGSDASYDVLAGVARDGSEVELQRKAIRYLGVHHSERSLDLLVELYGSLSNVEARRAVLQSFMVSGEKDRLLAVARDEPDEELRGRAIRLLGTMNASDELWELYGREQSEEVRKRILQGFMVSGEHPRLLDVARNADESDELRKSAIRLLGAQNAHDELWELYQSGVSDELMKSILHGLFVAGDVERLGVVATDTQSSQELRRSAIHNLGLSGERSRPLLMTIYESDVSTELKRQVLRALFLQGAASELINIARAESDAELKKRAVHHLSLMDVPEAKDFMMEILRR